ncbi:MAG: hypothetical protein IPK72_17615 [Candidatus Eisenbacteria bacterium]|nr:hypothetical protein [Candidatus Eisenbacteria bacterium]
MTGVTDARYPFRHPTVLREMAEEIERHCGAWWRERLAAEHLQHRAAQTTGVNMAQRAYADRRHNSIWTRDYGPQFVFDGNGAPGIVDHVYNRPRPLDDQVNYTVGTSWTTQVFGLH